MNRNAFVGAIVAAAGMCSLTSFASAGTLTVTLSGTNNYSGTGKVLETTAVFSNIGGGVLRVTLTNSALTDVTVPSDVLTGMFFDTSATLAPQTAFIAAGSVIYHTSTSVFGNDVGGEWAYGSGLSGAPHGATKGISSSGLGLFGDPNFAAGPAAGVSITDPTGVDGLNWGLVSAGDDSLTGNGGVKGAPLVHNHVVFELSGISAEFNPMTDSSNVSFQYGTNLLEPNLFDNVIPLPTTAGMGLAGMLLLGVRRRRF